MCFQVTRRLMRRIRLELQLYCTARMREIVGDVRIARTWPLVTFAFVLCSPRRITRRFFLSISAILSALVPTNRWSGLTQHDTSQVCSTDIPLGILPLCNSYDNRCAESSVNLSFMTPYSNRPPLYLRTAPTQSQQPDSVTGTYFASNRSRSVYFLPRSSKERMVHSITLATVGQ